MAADDEPKPSPYEKMPGEATSHNPGITPKPADPAGDTEPADGAPYEKKPDPATQPS